MPPKIPKEKLQDLYERSVNQLMDPAQCVVWLPLVCEYALELIVEQESREQLMEALRKIERYKREKKDES